MTPKDALRKMVKAFPGGYAAMAARVGKTPEVLRKELSDSESFKLGLETAQLISEICIEARSPGCFDYVTAVAADSGVMLQLPAAGADAVACIHTCVGHVVKELSDTTQATLKGWGDGVISHNDMTEIEREIAEAFSALQRLQLAVRKAHISTART